MLPPPGETAGSAAGAAPAPLGPGIRDVFGIVCLVLGSALLCLTLWALIPALILGWTPHAITSDTMAPLIQRGDVVLTSPPEAADALEPPTVVVLSPDGHRDHVVHRIVGVNGDGTYVTRGDARSVRDATRVDPARVSGVGRLVVPLAGLPSVWVSEGRIHRVVTLLGLALLCLWGVRFSLFGRNDPGQSASVINRRAHVRGRVLTVGAAAFAALLITGPAYSAFVATTATGGSWTTGRWSGYVYSGSGDGTLRQHDADGTEVWSVTGHVGSLRAVAVDADGLVYSGSDGGTVRKIDADGNQLWSFTGHTDAIRAVAVDSSGQVYSAAKDDTLRKLDSDGNQVWSFTGHAGDVRGVAVDADGFVYSGSSDNTVRKLDPDGNQVWSFTGHTDELRAVAVDLDGYVYSAALDGTVRKIGEDGAGDPFEVWSFTHDSDTFRSVAVDPGAFSTVGHVAPPVPSTPENLTVTDTSAWSVDLAWDPADDAVAYRVRWREQGASTWTQTTLIFDTSTTIDGLGPDATYEFEVRAENLSGTSNWSATVTATTLETLVYTGGADSTSRSLASSDGQQAASFTAHTGTVRAVAVDADGYVYTGADDTTVRKRDRNGTQIWSFSGHTGMIQDIAVDADGYVYTASNDRSVRKLDSDGTEVWSFPGHTSTVWAVTVDADGYVYSGAGDRTVRKLDPDGNQVWSYNGNSQDVRGLAVDDSGHVFVAYTQSRVRKLDPDGSLLWSFDAHTQRVNAVAVDADGFVYTASDDTTVRKLGPNGNQLWSFNGHSQDVVAVAVDADGFVYTASRDATVRKLDPDGNQLWSFNGHPSWVEAVAVDPGAFTIAGH